jgi:hypothetical protein
MVVNVEKEEEDLKEEKKEEKKERNMVEEVKNGRIRLKETLKKKKENDGACDQENDCGKWRGKRGKKWENRGEKFRGKWERKASLENVSSDSEDEKLSLEQIKKEMSSLVEEMKLLKEKKGNVLVELKNIRTKIGEMRRNTEGSKEAILALRNDAVAKRKEMKVFAIQIVTSKNRISKLRSIAVMKE